MKRKVIKPLAEPCVAFEQTDLDRFMSDISQHPLLSRTEEQQLFQRLAEGDTTAKELILSRNYRLVVAIARNYMGSDVPLDDLIQEGFFGLDRAVNKFDYRKGHKFSTYATWWIRQSIVRAIPDLKNHIHIPAHLYEHKGAIVQAITTFEIKQGRKPTLEELYQALNSKEFAKEALTAHDINDLIMSLDKPIKSHEIDVPTYADVLEDTTSLDGFQDVVEYEDLYKALAQLPERDQDILRQRFGLDCKQQTLMEIGKKYNLSRERIRQVEAQALKRLKTIMENMHQKKEAIA